jgi:MYXO-CTERM domain-containing protein
VLTSFGSRHVLGWAALGAALLSPATSEAHFVLTSPAASTEQNALGDPQKAPPCGDDNGSAVATGIVTTYQAGQTITVTIDETIFHPGHYRIALAVNDPSELPPEPIVTPGATACGSAPIDPAPVFPVLADGVFQHETAFTEPQSIEITLPDDVTCTHCTLQIIQFMSNHALNNPGGCYYHHCAEIALEEGPVAATSTSGDDAGSSDGGGPTSATSGDSADGTAGPAATSNASADGSATGTIDADTGAGTVATTPGSGDGDGDDGGCSCSSHRRSPDQASFVLGLLGLLGLRLRRRRRAAAAD